MTRDLNAEARTLFPKMLALARGGCRGVVEHGVNEAISRIGGWDALRTPEGPDLIVGFMVAWREVCFERASAGGDLQ